MQRNYRLHYHENFEIETKQKYAQLTLEEVGVCPYCGIATSPTFIDGYCIMDNDDGIAPVAYILLYCPSCHKIYVAKYYIQGCLEYGRLGLPFHKVYHTCTYPTNEKKKEFSDEIKELSPKFVETYNQAHCAEGNESTRGLAGLGYRKAIEFLVKDYLIKINPGQEEDIIKKPLGKCIDQLHEDLQELAKAATWLGNDEAHYFKKHKEYGIEDMKIFIDSLLAEINRYYVGVKAKQITSGNK